MASFPTTPAFVVKGDYGPESRNHPVTRFLERCGKEFFDAREHKNIEDWYTKDFTIRSAHAEHFTSGKETHEHAIAKSAQQFFMEPMDEHRHVPDTMIAIESKDGYDVYAQFDLFANIKGKPVKGEVKIEDNQGRKWDMESHAFYYFDVVKDPQAKNEGFKIRHIKACVDTSVVNEILHKRGEGHRRSSKKHAHPDDK